MSYKKDGKCSNCGSKDRRYGEYTRAWNDLCGQSAGEAGYYCMNCTHIDFHTPDFEVWLALTPRWIVRKYGDAWRDDAEHRLHTDAGMSADLQASSNTSAESTSLAVA